MEHVTSDRSNPLCIISSFLSRPSLCLIIVSTGCDCSPLISYFLQPLFITPRSPGQMLMSRAGIHSIHMHNHVFLTLSVLFFVYSVLSSSFDNLFIILSFLKRGCQHISCQSHLLTLSCSIPCWDFLFVTISLFMSFSSSSCRRGSRGARRPRLSPECPGVRRQQGLRLPDMAAAQCRWSLTRGGLLCGKVRRLCQF